MVRKSKGAAKQPASPSLDEIEEALVKLREQGKTDPENTDYIPKLREILDQISDLKGEPRRPITAMPNQKDEESEEDEEEDENEEMKELVKNRLTTCMLLALTLNENKEESKDFFRKMKKRGDVELVLAPFTKEEMMKFNTLLKSIASSTRKKVADAR